MSVPLAQQAQAIRGQSALVLLTERVDDVALHIGQRVTMGLPEVLARPIPRHGTQRGRSWGWTAVVWLASIVTAGDHRHVAVATSLTGMPHPLRHVTAPVVEPLNCRDDRLRHWLQYVRKPTAWQRSECAWNARRVAVNALPQDVIRWEATTVAGDHEGTTEGRLQCGQRHEEPARPQRTGLRGSLAPVGMPLSTEGLAGARADDGVYRPLIERLRTGVPPPGLLCVGAWQRRALDTRASLARPQDWSVSPWPLTGATAAARAAWSTAGVTKREAGAGAQRWRTNAREHEGLAAEGDECARPWCAPGGDVAGCERVVVVRSPLHATHQAAGLATRLRHAETPLTALRPPSGRRKRHSTDDATLVEAIALVLTAHRVEALLSGVGEQPVEQTTQDVDRGRGSGSREKHVLQPTRSYITHLARQADTIAARRQRCGWQACVTKAEHTRRSWQAAVVCSHNAYRGERLFKRLKSRLPLAPRCVTRNEHREGRTSLLTLGVRVCTVTACVLRRSLETAPASLPG